MRKIGRTYTSTNSHVYSKIDRALVNHLWKIKWLQLDVQILDPQYCDHCMLCVNMETHQWNGPKPFKIFKHLANHQDFQELVRLSWNQQVTGGKMECMEKVEDLESKA
ncbi:hypothetical protein RDI58_017844 [Solanum bulbocastanum]|uniref:Uncharacterized protein n=1 Tax=Solanum bulbocastanum TaxID=147425 RepID=A0AAN8Y977_SOLBU